MAFDFSNISDEELEAMAAQSAPASGFGGAAPSAPQKPLSEWTDEELEAFAAEPTPAPVQSAAQQPRKLTQEERIAQYQRAIETTRSQKDPGFLSAAGEAIAEGAKGAARAVKSVGSGFVGMASGAVRLAGTPVRVVTGWEGLHRLADTIDSSYENFGRDALMSEYGENPDGFGYAAGRFGEKLAGTAGSLAGLGAAGKAVGAAGTALKMAGHAKTATAVANTLPLMFGNDAAVRAYDTARANGKSKGEAASLAGLNGAIHFLGFKAFENKALNKMLGMPAEMEAMMPKWAGEAAEAGGQSFSSLARGVRNGMIKYTLAERGKGALRAGGIMGLQNFLSDPVMQVAEGASIDDIDFSHALKAGAEGVGEGVLMEGALGAAAVLKSPAEARKFIADKIFRGKDYKVVGPDGKPHDEPGLLNTSEGRMFLMKQNPDATERVLDIVEHGGTPRPAELDAAFLPPDMTAEELKKFAADWRNDLKPYVDEAWAADAPRRDVAPDASAAGPGRDILAAGDVQRIENDAQERYNARMLAREEAKARAGQAAYDQAMLEREEARARQQMTQSTGEKPNEARNGTDEAPAPAGVDGGKAPQPTPEAGQATKPVESAEARTEAPNAGVVEPQTAENRTEATQEGTGARPASETSTATPAPAKPVEAPSRVSGAEPVPDGKPSSDRDYLSETADRLNYDEVIDTDTYSNSDMRAEYKARIGELTDKQARELADARRKERAADKKLKELLKGNDDGAIDAADKEWDAAVVELQSVESKLKITESDLIDRIEAKKTPPQKSVPDGKGKMVKPKPKSAEGAGAASRASDAEKISPNLTEKPAETAKPVSETPKTEASMTTPAESRNAAPGISADDFVAAHSTTDDKGKRVANKDIDIQGEITPPPDYAAKKVKPVKPGDATAALKAVGRNASQDDTRIALKRVHVEGGQMVATDGRRLVVAPAPDGVADGDYDAIGAPIKPTESYVPYPTNWRQAVPDVKRHGYRKIGEIANGDAAHGHIAFADETAGKVRRAKGGDLAVLLRVGNAGANPQFAKDVVNTMFALGAERLEVFQAPDFAPVVLKGRNAKGEIIGVVMPLRIDGKSDVISEKQTQVKLFSDVANTVQTEGAKSASRASGAVVEIDATTRESAKRVRLSAEAIADIKDWIAKNPNGNFTHNGFQKIFDAEMERVKAANGGVNPKVVLPTLDAISVAYHDMKSAKPVEAPSRASDAEPAVSVLAPAPATQTQTNIPNEKKSSAQESASPSATWTDRGGTTHKLDGFDPPSADNITKGRTVAIRHDNGVLYSGELVGIGPKNVKIKTQSDMYGEQVLTFPKADVVGVKSNRLRRADGTDPLAEREQAAAQSLAVPAPVSRTVRNNLVEKRLRPILDFVRNEDGSFNPDALRNHDGNNGLPLKDLKLINEHPEIVDDLGLPAEDAAALKSALTEAYNTQRVATPNSKEGKVSEAGQFNYSVSASKALERLARQPNNLRALVTAQQQVSAAYTAAKDKGNGQSAKFWENRLTVLNDQIGRLPAGEQAKIPGILDSINGKKSAMERKNTQSLESGEGKTLDVADGGSADEAAPASAPKGGATGTGGSLGGNRHLIIDGVNGDELTVTMKDAAGKTLATRKMNRAQWSALSQGAVATDGDPANPQKGDLIRMSRSDATDAPQSWTPEAKKPLERVAHVLRNVVTVGGKRLKVEFLNERPADVDGQTRKSIGGVFTGTAADYANRSRQGGVDDGPSLKKIGTGEGSQVYGWGLYGSTMRGVAEGYARGGVGSGRVRINGKKVDAGSNTAEERVARRFGWQTIKGRVPTREQVLEDTKTELSDRRKQLAEGGSDNVRQWVHELEEDVALLENRNKTIEWVSPGNIYEQTFFTNRAPGDESHLLNWYGNASDPDLNFAEQEKWIRAQAKKEGVKLPQDLGGFGNDIYETIVNTLGSPQAASEFLARAGIDGVKYPVGTAGGKVKDGDKVGWNYVSFRDDNIRVDHKWTDGELRYMRNADGVTVGEYDAAKGEIRLYPGATVADVVHEFTHPLMDYARAEAKAGRGEFLNKIKGIVDAERATWEEPVREAYKDKGEDEILEEIFTHAMGEKGEKLFGKSTNTLQGRQWYNRLWQAIKEVWQDFATKMGWNKADLRGLERMSPEDAAQKILSEMAKGRNFGDAPRSGGIASPVREARSPSPADSRIMDDEQTKGEKFTEKFIDSFAPVKSVQDKIGGVKEVTRADGYTDHTKSTDLVAAKDKANGRIEYELRQHQFRVDDINRDLSRAALPKQSTEDLVDDFNLYLQCKHAPERNLSIAQDRGDAYTPDYSEGMGQITLPGGNRIGLSENIANRLLKGLRGKYGLKIKMFENAADKVYKMLEADLDRRFDAGRLSAEDYAFYKTRWHGPGGADGKWAHYVPLKTDMERLEPDALNSSTAGMKRNEFMKAQGRGMGDIADSPLAAAVLQTEQGIRGSIKNEVANVEANLVEHAQKRGKTIAEIVPGDEIRRGRTYSFTFADGETVDASGSMRLIENHPEIHLFKRDGKLYAIRYDKGAKGRGLAFAKAASGENMGRWGQGLEWIPHMTHWMSAMRTQYSPEFTVSNWLADHLEAAQALVGRYGLKEGGKAFAKTVASEIQNWKDLRAYLKDGRANGYIKEFVEGGGLTKGGVASEGFEAETQKIRSKIEQFRREQKQWREMSLADLAKSLGRNITNFLSFANELAEYSTRTGLYTALRKMRDASGKELVSKADAIKFARDATVNFNRKGTAMPYINGLYMFANASVQGAVRSVQAMRDTHGKELVAALTAIGVAKAVIDNFLGNDDEREAAGGRNARNQSEYDKKHNVGVPIGGGRQIVPLRFRGPYAAIPYLAQTAANVAMGVTSPEDGAKTLFRELGDQVTDLVGGNGIMNDRGELDGALIGQSLAPSVADPIVQLATGKDYKGDERRRKSFDKTMPASSNGKRSTASGYKLLAKGINAIPFLSGGNEFRKGRLDFAPEDYQLVLEFLGGAPMRDINNVASSVNNAVQLASGRTPERTLSQIPFVRRIVREYPESTSRYYDALEEYERDKAEFKKTTPERRREMKADKPYLFTGKSILDGQIARIKELTHLERGEIKVNRKWIEPKTPRSEKQKEEYRKMRLKLQARVLKTLGR